MLIDPTDGEPTASSLVPASELRKPGGIERFLEALEEGRRADAERDLRDEVDSAVWQESIAASSYEQARARVDINRLLHYGHPIPVGRGYTFAYVAENYPGWTWNELLDVLEDARVVVHGVPPRCHPGVGAVHFSHDGSWLVEWEDGRVTRSTDVRTDTEGA
ncbi:hypothetical protein [Microbacterium sp. 2FI]|uniref:hypothetical protein n=1 Tax=Microbacterium sp. 2FI TaxID=2502193 RepID=UPI0014853E79|nr:hypothetical protein [Microbacterium sp. 2FI]